jgi:hypothetical protein
LFQADYLGRCTPFGIQKNAKFDTQHIRAVQMIGSLARFASSFAALLSEPNESEINGRTADIREAMQEAMAPYIRHKTVLPLIWRSIAVAPDIDSLWYLRSNLLAMLSEYCGERGAQSTLATITEMFRGAVPDTRMPKKNRFNER